MMPMPDVRRAFENEHLLGQAYLAEEIFRRQLQLRQLCFAQHQRQQQQQQEQQQQQQLACAISGLNNGTPHAILRSPLYSCYFGGPGV